MSKQIFLYIGPHRTGTTFLQNNIFPYLPGVCNVHSRDPECNDILFDATDQHPMFLDLVPIRNRLLSRFEKFDEETVLLGDGHLFGDYGRFNTDGYYVSKAFYDHKKNAKILSRLFDAPKIIMTPRRQDRWLESCYTHFVHNYFTVTIDEFLNPAVRRGDFEFKSRSLKPCCDTTVLDWSVYVDNYYTIFGRENVLVIPNEMMGVELDAFLARLCAFLDVPAVHPLTVDHVNRSYSELSLRLALTLNRFVWTSQNRFGIIPLAPFNAWIQRKRKVKDTKVLWFLAGVTRRLTLHWFLSEVVDRFNYQRPDILGPERRQAILAHYKDANRKLATMIGIDLGRFGYY